DHLQENGNVAAPAHPPAFRLRRRPPHRAGPPGRPAKPPFARSPRRSPGRRRSPEEPFPPDRSSPACCRLFALFESLAGPRAAVFPFPVRILLSKPARPERRRIDPGFSASGLNQGREPCSTCF